MESGKIFSGKWKDFQWKVERFSEESGPLHLVLPIRFSFFFRKMETTQSKFSLKQHVTFDDNFRSVASDISRAID